MARAFDTDILIDGAGNAVANAHGLLYADEATTIAPTDAFAGAAGGSAVTAVTTDSSGRWKVYFTSQKPYWIKWDDNGNTAHYIGSSDGLSFATFTSQQHQAFEPPVDDARAGTWAQMQAVTPTTAGTGWYASDQGIQYRWDGSAWKRMSGDPMEIWITDFGAVPNVTTTPQRSANVVAIEAARDESYARSTSSSMPACAVVANSTVNGHEYYTNAMIDMSSTVFIGRGAHQGAFARSRGQATISCNSTGEGCLIFQGTTSLINWTEGIYAKGVEWAFKVTDGAMATFENVSGYCDNTGNADNATFVIENAFWVEVNYFGFTCGNTSPTTVGGRDACSILFIASDGDDSQGVLNSGFRNGVCAFGGARLENRLVSATTGGGSVQVTFDNVYTESQGPQAFMQFAVNGATKNLLCRNFHFNQCGRADAAGRGSGAGASQAAFHVTGDGTPSHMQIAGLRCTGSEMLTQWGAQVINNAILRSFESDEAFPGDLFDPANTGSGSNYGSIWKDVQNGNLYFRYWRLRLSATVGSDSFTPLIIPHGGAPAGHVDGSIWTRTTGLFARINGADIGPLGPLGTMTQTYATADATLGAYTSDPESSAYTGAADSEAKLADLNALRVAYENLRAFTEDLAAFTNSLVDKFQTTGMLS